MNHVLIVAGLWLFSSFTASAQVIETAVDNSYVITRMVAKYHVSPRAVDPQFSADFFNTLLKKTLDEDKVFFTFQDIEKLEKWKFRLDTVLLFRRKSFLELLTDIYTRRIHETDSLIEVICSKPFNFSLKESFTASEDSTFRKGIRPLMLAGIQPQHGLRVNLKSPNQRLARPYERQGRDVLLFQACNSASKLRSSFLKTVISNGAAV